MSRINDFTGTILRDGTVAVSVTGTAVPFATTASALTACLAVIVTAHPLNSGQIWIGGSGVIASPSGSETGTCLQPNEKFSFDIDDLTKIYLNGTAGDKATYLLMN